MAIITQADLAPFMSSRSGVSLSASRLDPTFTKTSSEKRASDELLYETRENSIGRDFDIFLSHKFGDAEQLLALRELLKSCGYSVYVDWLVDNELDRSRVNHFTAQRLKFRMDNCKCLLYATTTNHSDSKWMPWEMGYFDGHHKGRVAIVPVYQSTATAGYQGQEYLGMYPYVDKVGDNLWINSQFNGTYISFEKWLLGENVPAK